MRLEDIKFRIWDKREKVFLRDILMLNYLKQHPESQSLYEIQPFTGVTSVDGKDVYEGDILKTAHIERLFVVMWVEWRWNAISIRPVQIYQQSHFGKYFKLRTQSSNVVGNIFENPELTKI